MENNKEEPQVIENTPEAKPIVIHENKPLAVSQPVNDFIAMMERLATNKDVDINKIQQIREMYNDELDRSAKREFAADFVLMRPHLPVVIRLKKNDQTKSKYAPLEDINKVIDPIIGQYGFATATNIIAQTDKDVTVEAILWHRSGHQESNILKLPIDDRGMAGTVNKTQPHAISSSITYCKRVALCALLNISTGDDKDGNDDTGFILEEVAEIIKDKIKAFEQDYINKFLGYMKVESVDKIPANDAKKAFNALAAKKKKFDEENAKKEVK